MYREYGGETINLEKDANIKIKTAAKQDIEKAIIIIINNSNGKKQKKEYFENISFSLTNGSYTISIFAIEENNYVELQPQIETTYVENGSQLLYLY